MKLERRPENAVNWPRAVQSSVAILGALSFGAMAYGYGYGVSGGRAETYPQAAAGVVAGGGDSLLFTDGFESGDMTTSNAFFNWISQPACASIVDSVVHTGSNALRLRFNGSGADSTADAGCEPNFFVDSLPNVTFEFQIFVDSNFVHRLPSTGSNNNKFFAFWQDTSSTDRGYNGPLQQVWEFERRSDTTVSTKSAVISADTLASNAVINRDTMFIAPASVGMSITRGNWHKVQICMQAASDSLVQDGHSRIAIDDSTVTSVENFSYYPSTGIAPEISYGYLMGYSNSGYTDTTYFYFDEWKVYNQSLCPAPV